MADSTAARSISKVPFQSPIRTLPSLCVWRRELFCGVQFRRWELGLPPSLAPARWWQESSGQLSRSENGDLESARCRAGGVASQGFASRDWIIRDHFVDAAGSTIAGNGTEWQACANYAGKSAASAFESCLAVHGIANSIVYQAATRYVIFQGIETAHFLGLAAVLLGITFWWVVRRVD
jgi:hypothetical protein